MSCQNLTWQPQGSAYWKDPVSTKAALNTIPCDASTAWQTRIVQTPSVGTGPRAYTCNGSSWMPLAVDDSGNLTVTGTLSLGKALVNDVVTEGSACTPNGLVARDSVGLILSCQSGIYKKGTGGETGLRGMYDPLKGKSASCAISVRSVYASVSTAGDITLGGNINGATFGCTNPPSGRCGIQVGSTLYEAVLTGTGVSYASNGTTQCSGLWPLS
ncbi:shufflon system plasmid conjugative transfer pilus tip adhesin PilV [Methylovorus glucosotrophus]|uniref:Bacterial shufflon protein N-terminal domain-containing protein n=1 Tax=Methylovorus glucosotrophus (strain SIP3-4) TaxID=582744 RepID=C6XET9_METGS|nr:shufflon system plasmid conjugative transfer pilus tip adhesin PilV [Methylovorus glucosotrophus]ACT52146.1 hypothetical protein Msip34_2922 [Methylovorus glucosotrophus SIP3-4]